MHPQGVRIMSDLELLGIVAVALGGGVVGAALTLLVRLPYMKVNKPEADSRSYWNDRLEPHLADRVRDLSEQWAAQRGQPEATFLAAGYLQDAAEDLQRRWRDFR